jgi:hypothetical protein
METWHGCRYNCEPVKQSDIRTSPKNGGVTSEELRVDCSTYMKVVRYNQDVSVKEPAFEEGKQANTLHLPTKLRCQPP